MNLQSRKILKLVILYLVLTLSPIASMCCLAKPIPTRESSCKDFVQRFYTWYMALRPGPTEEIAFKKRPLNFDSQIVQAFKHYDQVAEKYPDKVGMEGDCFLNGQDWVDRKYVVDKVTVKNGVYRTYVYWIWKDGRKKDRTLSVMPELVFRQGHWVFVNFRYPPEAGYDHPGSDNIFDDLKYVEEHELPN